MKTRVALVDISTEGKHYENEVWCDVRIPIWMNPYIYTVYMM